ncbi:MAG: ribonuclease HII [Pseudomonadota bacterium]
MSEFDAQFNQPVCGIDEVGRGPLCGPVVAACAFIKPESYDAPEWQNITDSKKITAKKRETLFDFICENSIYGISEISPQEIDRLNIHHATLLAMKRAFEEILYKLPENMLALVDGKFPPNLSCKVQTVIKGDSLSLSIGAASIIAKVHRDRLMKKYHEEFPHYGWDTNSGYGTKVHMQGLAEYGLTPHHRLSFAPCAALVKKAQINRIDTD